MIADMLIFQTLTAVALTVAASTVFPLASFAQSSPALDHLRDPGVYSYPLLTLDDTRQPLTSNDAGRVQMNTFFSVPQYPSTDFKNVARSHAETLYSIAWLDLTQEPLVIAAPGSDGRFDLLPMLDMWSDVFASAGGRTFGTDARQLLVTPPQWTGTVPAGMAHLPAPTPYVWIVGRTRGDGVVDSAGAAGYTVTPLSQLGRAAQPVSAKVDPSALTRLYGPMAETLSGN